MIRVVIILIIFLFLLFFLFYYLIRKIRKKRLKLYLLLKNQWGKKRDKDRDFDKIPSFFYYNLKRDNTKYFVDENTFNDLNLESLFSLIDHTQSKIGEQVLYNVLRMPKKSKQELMELNCLIKNLCKNEDNRIEIQKQLSALNKPVDYHIADLLFLDLPKRPAYFWVIYLSQILLIAAIICSFFFRATIIALCIIFVVNFIIHYRTKNKFEFFFVGLDRIQILYSKVKRLIKIVKIGGNNIIEDISVCKKIISKLWIFKKNDGWGSDIAQATNLIIDLLKILTLFEVSQTYKVAEEFNIYKKSFLNLFCYLGQIDVALSVASFRKSLPYYCIPEFEESTKNMKFEKMYHPLINNCIPNDFYCCDNKSVFINGSNMSGKTTFIRAIGVNVLLASTIYTCTATRAVLSFFNLYSAIKTEDDIEEGISYYFKELLRLREMVEISDINEKQYNLFLIDEVLRGTNIYDRTRIAKSILNYLNNSNRNLIMVTSHDIDLAEQLKDKFDFYYFEETISDKDLDFDYKIHQGLSIKSNAVNLLKILDFPEKIITASENK